MGGPHCPIYLNTETGAYYLAARRKDGRATVLRATAVEFGEDAAVVRFHTSYNRARGGYTPLLHEPVVQVGHAQWSDAPAPLQHDVGKETIHTFGIESLVGECHDRPAVYCLTKGFRQSHQGF